MRQRIINALASQVSKTKIFRATDPSTSIENQLTQKLARHVYKDDVNQAKQEFKWMLDHLVSSRHKSRSPVTVESNFLENNPVIAEKIAQFVKERTEDHKPLQYILGTQPFGELDLVVRSPVLIPRWETEEWAVNLCTMLNNVDLMIKDDRRKLRILDIGTGSGCIALLLASRLPKGRVEVYGIDQSKEALDLAFENKLRNFSLLQNPVDFNQIDIFDDESVSRFVQSHGDVDMIVSNPPYIPPSQYSELPLDVKDWEDRRALLADDEHGLIFYKRILELAVAPSKPLLHSIFKHHSHGMLPLYAQLPQLVLEVGTQQQANQVAKLSENQFKHSKILKDLAGQDRVVLAYQTDISL